MTETPKKPSTLVIGAGLTGLFLAHRLHLAGHEVRLLEAQNHVGGRYRRGSNAFSSPGLDFIPAGQEYLQILEWLKNTSPLPVSYQLIEHHPQMFDEGKWKPFAGFGETAFLSVDELSSLYSHSQGLQLDPGLEQLARALTEQLPFSAETMMEVTAVNVENGKVASVTVNGDKAVSADNVIFTPHPQMLNALIPGEALSDKHRTRLAKMQSWTAVTLELNHSPALLNDSSVRIFNHNAKEFEPVVGRAWGEKSKWMTLVPGDREADHEFVGQTIRHIKRQLKRAFPLAFEGESEKSVEKIYVQANAYGQHSLKTKDSLKFPEIENLYMAGHALATVPGELGALETVMEVDSQLCGSSNRLPELGASC